ncbi:Ig-like domain-containing protein [Winogradskyella sp. A2]|uniref:Ig-like domain-containing protein n=1 Tax=Winogradskyella sp. A2 TaxID=3366944 RepID=UPI00398C3EF8
MAPLEKTIANCYHCLYILIILFFVSTDTNAQIKAFPNAYGAGANVSGGRGGTVIHVTNLSNSNSPGSLRWALKQAYPRTIVFDVSGTIDLGGTREFINGPQYGDLTIAGQTAPEGGITLANGTFILQNMSNIIIRYIKARGGSAGGEWDSLRVFQSDNYIIDHCEFWYGTDEGLDTSDKTDPNDGNVTVQNSLFCENKTGLIMGIAENDGSNPSYQPVSVLRNMFVNVSHRFPKYAGEGRVDVINNGLHNWKWRAMRFDGFAFELNEIGNYYQSGTNSTTNINTADGLNKVRLSTNTYRIYTSGNYLESSHASALGITNYDNDNTLGWSGYVENGSINPSVFVNGAFTLNGVAVPILSSNEVKPYLIDNVGARHYLNADGSVGEYLDNLQSTYIGYFENDSNVSMLNYQSEYGTQAVGVPNNTRLAGFYITNPHIPEDWFQANVPQGQDHNDLAPSGYTWLEEYLNMVDIGAAGNVEATGLNITPDMATLNVPETIDLDVQFTPANTTNQSGVWTSENESIATVDSNGLVTSVSEGVVEIRFVSNDGSFTDTTEITVTNIIIPLESVAISPQDLTLELEDEAQLFLNFIPSNSTQTSGIWSSSDTSIAMVDENGNVNPISVGTAQIQFVADISGLSDSIDVTVVDTFFGTYEFYNTISDEMLQNIVGDTSINLENSSTEINFRSIPEGGDGNQIVGSIQTNWSGPTSGTYYENEAIYWGLPHQNDGPDLVGYVVQEGTYDFEIIYYAQNAAQGNIIASDTFSITFYSELIANAGDDQSICEGETVQLTASGGPNYLWSTGETTSVITVAPQITTTYTVTVSDNNGNSLEDSVTVFVDNLPDLTISDDVEIIEGESVTLTVEGANEYLWNTGQTTNTITVSPDVTTTYTVTGTNGACEVQVQVTVTVEELFEAFAGDDERICDGSGDVVTLSANSGDSYLWSTGETSQSISVSPISTTTYTVTVSSGVYEDSDEVTVFVDPNPNVVILNGDSVDILNGDFITLSASGANSYEWNNGATQPNIAVSPSVTTTYEVRGYINDCFDEQQVTVNVFEPVQAYAGEDVNICLNEVVTLTATGGDQFLWSTGEITQSIQVSPFITTDYTVTVFNALDFDEATVRVTVQGNCDESTENQNDDLSDDVSFNIYPNPAYSYVNVRLNGASEVSDVLIYDFTGKIVQQTKIENENQLPETNSRIELRTLSNGIYFVKLIDGSGNELTKKLIVR